MEMVPLMSVKAIAFGDTITPHQSLLDVLNVVDEIECCIVVCLFKDGIVQCPSSTGMSLQKIGMLQVAMTRQIEKSRE